MVKISIKNCINQIKDEEQIATVYPFITNIIEKTKTDENLNKFISICLKYNILVFEKIVDIWSFKNKIIIENEIQIVLNKMYND